jgi:hypothetical protein
MPENLAIRIKIPDKFKSLQRRLQRSNQQKRHLSPSEMKLKNVF